MSTRTSLWTWSRLSSRLALCLLLGAVMALSTSVAQEAHPLEGESIDMTILGIGGWVPSSLGAEMANDLFKPFALEEYGYDVTFPFDAAPFAALFQRAAASLATRSNEYNIIISDSQWLGALSEPGWIVNVDEIIEEHPELDIEWYSEIVGVGYQEYPMYSGIRWGFPQAGDVVVMFVRRDMLHDEAERAAFLEEYGRELPYDYEDFLEMSYGEFEDIAAFFTRPDEGLYGHAFQYSREYDFLSMWMYPFMFSLGGDIGDFEDENRVYGILNSEVNARAMEINRAWQQYMPPGAINFGIAEIIDLFTAGQVFSAQQWAAVGPAMIPDDLPEEFDVMVVPPPGLIQDDGSFNRLYNVGGQPWVINAFNTPEQMRVAIDFMRWWYLPETQMEYARRGGSPSDAATLNHPDYEDMKPWNRAFKFMLQDDNARDFYREPTYAQLLSTQQEAWHAFASGEIDDAMNTLEWIACEQQKILFDSGASEIRPPAECRQVRLR